MEPEAVVKCEPAWIMDDEEVKFAEDAEVKKEYTKITFELVKRESNTSSCKEDAVENMSQATLDNAKKIGAGGEKGTKLNDIDKVIDIIGIESPAVVSLNVAKTFEEEAPKICEVVANSEVVSTSPTPTLKRKSAFVADGDLKRQKLQLQVEHLKLCNRKMALEMMLLEKQRFESR